MKLLKPELWCDVFARYRCGMGNDFPGSLDGEEHRIEHYFNHVFDLVRLPISWTVNYHVVVMVELELVNVK